MAFDISGYTKEEIAQAAELYPYSWSLQHELKTSAGLPFEFKNHRFMREPLNDLSPLQVWLKPPQIGATESQIIKSLWVAKKLKKDVIYTLPTQADVQDMAGGKINRIIAQNPVLRSWTKDHDTVEQKQVGENIIYYRGCVDTDTEILTENGWMKFGFVTKGDRLPSLNILTNQVEMDSVQDISAFPINGDMVRIRSRQVDQLVTPDHRSVVAKRTFAGTKSPLRIVRAHEMVGKTTHYIPMSHEGITMPSGNAGDTAFYKILGWVIGDGSFWTKRDKSIFVRKDGTINPSIYESRKVCIIQSKFCAELEADLAAAGIGYFKKPHNNSTCFRYELNAAASVAIRDAIPAKHLTMEMVFNATPFERRALYEGLMMSDGNNSEETCFYQNRGETVEAFQALLVLLGKTSSKTGNAKCITTSIKQSAYAHVKASYQPYKGVAWCPTTRNGTIFIRRNGIVSVTGQTFSSKQAMMVSSQLNIHDEVDASDPAVITQYETRQQASADGWRWYFSHPSLSGFGVDVYWQQSDKKEWFITCPSCSLTQLLSWPDNIDEKTAAYVCAECRASLPDECRIRGTWKATAEGLFSGFHISQLMCPWISAKAILAAYHDPAKDKQYFYNYVLGLPYIGSDAKIQPKEVLANCIPDINSQEGKVIIGVDTGLPIHYVIGNKEGIFYYGKCKEPSASYDPYDELAGFLERWPKSIIVSDQGGDLIGIRKLQAKYPGRVFLCWYRKDRKSPEVIVWGEGEQYGSVVVDRNKMIQLMVEQLREVGRIRLNGAPEDWQEFANHFGNIYREQVVVKETKDKDVRTLYGNEYVWKRNGPDHFVHCLNYLLVGLDRYGFSGVTVVGSDDFAGLPTARFFKEPSKDQYIGGYGPSYVKDNNVEL